MKTKLFFVTILLAATNAYADFAGVYGYDYWIPIWIQEYVAELVKPSALELARQADPQLQASFNPQKCSPVFEKAFAKNQLDIRYALGYFDDSNGEEQIWDGKNFGMSPSLDIDVYEALHLAITRKCEGSLVFCGFKVSGERVQGKTVYTKKVNILGREIVARFELTQASASGSHQKNLNELKETQALLTKQSEESFFGGLAEADIVFYNGHSRNGGGPDFNPPVLDSHFKPNYDGYYRVKKPGITRAISQIKKNPNQGLVYGSFSCYSHMHFYNMLIKANPKIRMVLSAETIDYRDTLVASIGYLEGLLQGRCGEDLAQYAKRDQHLYDGFKGFQIK